MTARYTRLEEVVLDPLFPDVDLALRRGRHVTADELAFYTFLSEAREYLEPLYRRYGCDLVHKADGFFYLLPTGEKLGKRHLRPVEMLVGQALALLYLDPRTVEAGGTIVRDDVLGQLASVLGSDDLVRALYPGKKRVDERVAQEGVRAKVSDAIRKLGTLGFVSTTDEGRIRLSPALLRFAEPARLGEPPDVLLARLAAEGELVITEGLEDDGLDDEGEREDDDGPSADTSDDARTTHAPSAPAPDRTQGAGEAPADGTSATAVATNDDGTAEGRAEGTNEHADAAVESPSTPGPLLPIEDDLPAAGPDADDEAPFHGGEEDPRSDADDEPPFEPTIPPADDGPYELEGPFGNEADDDEIPFEIEAPSDDTTPSEREGPPPSER